MIVNTYEEWMNSDRTGGKVRIRTFLPLQLSKYMGDEEGTRRVEYWNPYTQTFYFGMVYTLEELKICDKAGFYKNPQTIKIETING